MSRRRFLFRAPPETNPFCRFRDRCLDAAGDLPALDCGGCQYVRDRVPHEVLIEDAPGCARLAYAVRYGLSAADNTPSELIRDAVLGPRSWRTFDYTRQATGGE
jgi:hypothetical protein